MVICPRRLQQQKWADCHAGQDAGWPDSETIAVADTASKIDAASWRCVPTLGNSALKDRGQADQGLGRRRRHNSVVGSWMIRKQSTEAHNKHQYTLKSITVSQPTWPFDHVSMHISPNDTSRAGNYQRAAIQEQWTVGSLYTTVYKKTTHTVDSIHTVSSTCQ